MANSEAKEKKRRLDPGSETVLIGFKGPKTLHDELMRAAAALGISYSEMLRAMATDLVKQVKKTKGLVI